MSASAPEPAAAAEAAPLPVMFGKYRVVKPLGAGGMAQVFLASLDGPDGFSKTCVIKRILPEYAKDEAFSAMFVNEAKVAAMLTHPNIVQVFEFSKTDGVYYLAMEYVQGASLDRIIRAARKAPIPLGPRVAVEVGLGLANALAYAHTMTMADGTALNLVHRDISPDNVLISREGLVKLTDFGVVKSSLNGNATVAGVVKGKFSYMSPEQVTNSPLDHRSDLFTVGVLMFELSTGRRLFKGDSLPTTVNLVAQADVPPPSQFVPGFPLMLERIILKALEKDPAARYKNAAEMASVLESFRSSQKWTSAGRPLGAIVNTLFPREVTSPGASVPGTSGGSSPSESGVATMISKDDDGEAPGVAKLGAAAARANTEFDIVEEDESFMSSKVLLAVIAAAVIGTTLFWYLTW